MDKINEVLTRGVEKVYPSKEALEKVLRSGKKIRLYNGIDPTGSFLHLGHMVVLRKLRQFQDLGHHVILLIGDFTGMIGDPSGKSKARKPMTRKELLENAKTYKNQASKILNFSGENPVEIKYNSEWLGKLSLADIMHLASLVTYPQIIERDMFQRRMKEKQDIFLNELFYPIMQGYDSVAMNVDLEIGGSDQTFNMLMGRTLMKKIKNKEKFVLTTLLLAIPGKEKMGKTEDSLIALTEKPTEMFGKIMAWPDEMIIPGFALLTDVSLEDIKRMEDQLKSQKINPRDLKKRLAREVVTLLYSKSKANNAEASFTKQFQEGKPPSEIPWTEGAVKPGDYPISKIIPTLIPNYAGTASISETKRLIKQEGLEFEGKVVRDPQSIVHIEGGEIVKAGKRIIVKIKTKK